MHKTASLLNFNTRRTIAIRSVSGALVFYCYAQNALVLCRSNLELHIRKVQITIMGFPRHTTYLLESTAGYVVRSFSEALVVTGAAVEGGTPVDWGDISIHKANASRHFPVSQLSYHLPSGRKNT